MAIQIYTLTPDFWYNYSQLVTFPPNMNYFPQYKKIIFVSFLDLLIFFLLGFFGFQVVSLLIPPPKGPDMVRTPLTPFTSPIIYTVVFIAQVLSMNVTHNKLLKTKKEVKISHILFLIIASVFPLYLLFFAYSAESVRNTRCQAEIAMGDHGVACGRGEDFGKGIVVLFMMFGYILMFTLISLFVNLRSFNLQATEYKKFLMKTGIILLLLSIIFTYVYRMWLIGLESKRPQTINPEERFYSLEPVFLPPPSQKVLSSNKEVR